MWGTVNFSVCGKHWSCLWKRGGGKDRKKGSFQSLLQQEPKMVCLQIYPYGKPWWRLDSAYQSFPGASAPRQSWSVWKSTSRYSVQVALIARKATKLLYRDMQSWSPLASTFTCLLCPTTYQRSLWKMKLIWELTSIEMTDSGTPNFPSINSRNWKNSG